jgi:hypothetical protein
VGSESSWCIGNFIPDTGGPVSFGNKLPETPSSAIRVMTNDAITVPKKIDVVGALRCDPDTQELVINAVGITQHPEVADPVKPVEWANLGGVSGAGLNYVLDPSQTVPYPLQPGVPSEGDNPPAN